LKLDNKTGHVVNDPEAMKMWARDYQKGWEVTVIDRPGFAKRSPSSDH
jgi:hypothetical protein